MYLHYITLTQTWMMFLAKAAWLSPCWLHEWRSGKVQGLDTESLDWRQIQSVGKSIMLFESHFPQMLDWDYTEASKTLLASDAKHCSQHRQQR